MRLEVADCQPETLLKIKFFIGIFQGFWLQISKHLFSRILLKWLLLQRHIQGFVKHLRWSFFVNIINGLEPLTIFTKKLHLRCFTRLCVHLCSEVTSSIYQTYKFKVYCNSFWRHCTHKWNFMPAQQCNVILKSWAFVRLYFCYKYKTNQLYHVSKEDVKWLSYLGVQYYSFHESNFWEKIKLKEKNLSHKDVIKKTTLHYHFHGAKLKTSLYHNIKKWIIIKHFFVGGDILYIWLMTLLGQLCYWLCLGNKWQQRCS